MSNIIIGVIPKSKVNIPDKNYLVKHKERLQLAQDDHNYIMSLSWGSPLPLLLAKAIKCFDIDAYPIQQASTIVQTYVRGNLKLI